MKCSTKIKDTKLREQKNNNFSICLIGNDILLINRNAIAMIKLTTKKVQTLLGRKMAALWEFKSSQSVLPMDCLRKEYQTFHSELLIGFNKQCIEDNLYSSIIDSSIIMHPILCALRSTTLG